MLLAEEVREYYYVNNLLIAIPAAMPCRSNRSGDIELWSKIDNDRFIKVDVMRGMPIAHHLHDPDRVLWGHQNRWTAAIPQLMFNCNECFIPPIAPVEPPASLLHRAFRAAGERKSGGHTRWSMPQMACCKVYVPISHGLLLDMYIICLVEYLIHVEITGRLQACPCCPLLSLMRILKNSTCTIRCSVRRPGPLKRNLSVVVYISKCR